MKNKLVSKNLFVEGLHQLKSKFIICSCIFISLSIIVPLLISINTDYHNIDVLEIDYTVLNINLVIGLIPYIVAPIFAFSLFSFCFKRRSSDFYHSLSFKREPLYVSFILSATVACFALILGCILVSSVMGIIFIKTLEIIPFLCTLTPILLNLTVASLLMICGIALGCALSGRFISALGTALILLFFPRIFISTWFFTLKKSNYLIPTNHFKILFDNSLNALTGGFVNEHTEYKSVIYTLVLSLIFLIIGIRFFKQRKSELAQRSSMTKGVQTIFRTVFSLVFCLPACFSLFDYIYLQLYSKYDTTSTVTTCIIFWFLAIVAYFLFEIITQRSVKTLKKAMLKFSYVIVLNIAIIGALFGANAYINSYKPTKDKIDSVRILEYDRDNSYNLFSQMFSLNDGSYYEDDYYSKPSYNIGKAEEISIKNDEIKEIICNSLSSNISINSFRDDRAICVAFEENGNTRYRNVSIKQTEINKLIKLLAKEKDFTDALTNYPEQLKVNEISYNDDYGFFNDYYYDDYYDDSYYDTESKEKLEKISKEIYPVARKEIKNLSDEELDQLVANNFFSNYDNYYDDSNGYLGGYDKKNNYYYIPILNSMVKTNELIYEYTVNSEENQEQLKEAVNHIGEENYSTEFWLLDEHYLILKGKTSALKEYILNKGLKKTENSVIMNCCVTDYNDNYEDYEDSSKESEYYSFNFYIDKDDVEKFFGK